jgi:phospholipase D1/2
LTDTTVAADESPLAENDLMDSDHVPRSVAQSTLNLIESVATWPLRRSLLGTWYQNLRGISTVAASDRNTLPTQDL